jgi:uncharacterized protein YukJ
MPIDNYGVLKGKAIDRKLGTGSTPHYQIHLVSGNTHFRIAVNVKSQAYPSALLCKIVESFDDPMLSDLVQLPESFTPVKSEPGGIALDYVRGKLFDLKDLKPLKDQVPGSDNDLNEKIDGYVQMAMKEDEAEIYAFGSRWGPENEADRYFGFQPGNGIHDIHMNQGNQDKWKDDDGVWQDGALLFHYPSTDKWTAVFLAFQSQSFQTDDRTGHAL